jgi:hypothetical protein
VLVAAAVTIVSLCVLFDPYMHDLSEGQTDINNGCILCLTYIMCFSYKQDCAFFTIAVGPDDPIMCASQDEWMRD